MSAVLLLVVQGFQVVGRIMDLLPRGGDEEVLRIAVPPLALPVVRLGVQEDWPHVVKVNVKPLLS